MKNPLSRLRDRLRNRGTRTPQGGDDPSDRRITTEIARHGGLSIGGRPVPLGKHQGK